MADPATPTHSQPCQCVKVPFQRSYLFAPLYLRVVNELRLTGAVNHGLCHVLFHARYTRVSRV